MRNIHDKTCVDIAGSRLLNMLNMHLSNRVDTDQRVFGGGSSYLNPTYLSSYSVALTFTQCYGLASMVSEHANCMLQTVQVQTRGFLNESSYLGLNFLPFYYTSLTDISSVIKLITRTLYKNVTTNVIAFNKIPLYNYKSYNHA